MKLIGMGVFGRRKPVETEDMDATLREVVGMLPADRERTVTTTLLVELAAGLLLEMRGSSGAAWPTDRFLLLLNVLDRLGVEQGRGG